MVGIVGWTGGVAGIIEVVGGIITSNAVVGQRSKTAETIVVAIKTELLSNYLKIASQTCT